ncbi:CAP domain-containing protein [Bacillus sp. RG28]|uniref:CAP domain-containing protein n=1 Tax=Gottfriedia endophytica TaxID=2820819 RepID=A0A940NNH2_9BACI|nr:CAP domain-containing protein [Gottfriedia endophytica]MBP0724785.1 CAP domain-containing protein [Gottfriedia endophytica]
MDKFFKLIIVTIFATVLFAISPVLKDLYNEKIMGTKKDQNHQVENTFIQYTSAKNMKGSVAEYLGKNVADVIKQFGTPSRKQPSEYDYTWYIYDKDSSHYTQFGIEKGKVVTVFVAGDKINVSPFLIGEHYEDVSDNGSVNDKLSFSIHDNQYTFKLKPNELNERPLIPCKNGFAQLYFDRFTGVLLGIRYLDPKTLVKQRPYELIYTGKLINAKKLSSSEQAIVDREEERQILSLTNIYRARMHESNLKWNNQAAKVALGHSIDMVNNHYFDHNSPKYGTFADRLNKDHVVYQLAGENIAANYVDGISSVYGWINSKGHRENFYNKNFTSLGVGSYKKYQTQNFIK